MNNSGIDKIKQNMLKQQKVLGEHVAADNAIKNARAERDSENLEVIRRNTDYIVDSFYQSLILLEQINTLLEKSGVDISNLEDIKGSNDSILKMLEEEKFETEKERANLVARMLKVDTGSGVIAALQELTSYIIDNYEFK